MSMTTDERADMQSLSRLFIYARDESIRMGLLLEAQFANMAVLSLNSQQKDAGAKPARRLRLAETAEGPGSSP